MSIRTPSIALAASLFAAGILPACASKSEKPAAATPARTVMVVNTICPIAGDDFARHEMPASLTRSWRGTNIGFCCENCPPKFDAMTDSQKDAMLTLALDNKGPENPE